MGNFTSCFKSNTQTARLVDLKANLQHVQVSITVAEIMLEQPGYFVSLVVDDLASSFRLWALRADEALVKGKLYLLIPVGRLNSFVSESELEMLRSCCKSVKKVKRRGNSKVLPQVESACGTNEVGDGFGTLLEGFTSQRMGGSSPMWKPVLEPIYEE